MKLIINYQIADNVTCFVPPAGVLASRQKWGLRLVFFFSFLNESMRKPIGVYLTRSTRGFMNKLLKHII